MGVEIYVNFRAPFRQNMYIIRTKEYKIMKYKAFYNQKKTKKTKKKNVDSAAHFKTR